MLPNKIKSTIINTSLLIASFVVLIIFAEVILRFWGMADPIIYRSNPIYGYEPIPNQSSNRLFVPIFINDVGLRDNENYSDLDRSKIILVIGDSVTYGGSRINQQDLFTEILENKLRVHRPAIKVLNAGVNGYSISSMVHRAESLLKKIDPEYLVVYAIRNDFFRAPITFIAEGNFVYPTKKPSSALLDFLRLSVRHLDKRYDFLNCLPSKISQWFLPQQNYALSYDKSNIKETHISAIEDFVENTWEPLGHSRHKIFVFLSPNREDVSENHVNKNGDLQARFEHMNLRFYDLQKDFYTAIIAKGEEINKYYWDEMHYKGKGHSLAAEVVYRYLRSQKEFKVN